MYSIKKVLFLISIICLFTQCGVLNNNSVISVTSPDGKISADIYKGDDSKLYYKVESKGKVDNCTFTAWNYK